MSKNLPTTLVCGYQIAEPTLRKATEQIAKLANNIKSNYVKMGALFIKVRDDNLYTNFPTTRLNDDGTSVEATLADYAAECFGISKSALYRMISVTEKVYQPLLALQAEGCSSMPTVLLSLPDSALNSMVGFGGYDGLADFVNWLDSRAEELPATVRGFADVCHEYTDYLECKQKNAEKTVEMPPETKNKEREAIKETVKQLQKNADEIRESAEKEPSESAEESFEEAVFDLLETIDGSLSLNEAKLFAAEFKKMWFVAEIGGSK